MAQSPKRGIKADIKGPLIIAVVLAVVAFFGVLVFATGGTDNAPQFKLALTVSGAVFIVTVVVCATLIIVEKPNDEGLGQGTGVNRRSADLYAEARRRREERQKAEQEAAAGKASASDEAQYGERAHPKDHN